VRLKRGRKSLDSLTEPGLLDPGVGTRLRPGPAKMRRVDTSTRWPQTRADGGVVAAPHRLAAEAGIDALRRGGNAVDAAVAAAATIAVVYPHMNSIGGDSFWLIYDAGRGRLRALNAAGRSAAAATLEGYRARFGAVMPVRGGMAALTVPGTVAGWWDAHHMSREVMGSPLSFPTLLAHAIEHAREGFPPSAGQRRVTAAAAPLFAPEAAPEIRATFWPQFHPDRLAAERFLQPALADTLAAVATGGADEFYRGTLARRIAAGAAAVGSPLTVADLADHRAEWDEPLRVPYRGGEAASFPPPTQGFAALAILALLEGFDVAALDAVERIHLIVEATKLAFEDRDRYLTDPAAVPVPVVRCLDAQRLAERRRRIAPRAAAVTSTGAAGGDTIAIVTADAAGNAVSVIQSTYHEFGAAVVAGDTGVLLQNRGAFFSLDPAHPNRLAPRKHTAHTLIPSMYLVNGRPRFVYGTMGGEGQPQTQAMLVTHLVDGGLGPQAAVEAPRWLYGRTWGEDTRSLRLEGRFGTPVRDALRTRGHDAHLVEDWSDLMGHAQAIALGGDGLRGGSDPRADGAALGWSPAR
jgi:gamma-glutamyltranspeptidase